MCSSFQEVALIIYYRKPNRYSFNALVGALETTPKLGKLDVYFLTEKDNIIEKLDILARKYGKVVFTCSLMSSQVFETAEIIKKIKSKLDSRKIILVAGGPHPTGDPLGTLNLGFDIVFRGESEETFIEFMEKIIANDDWKFIRGISYFENSKLVSNLPARPVDINNFPPFSVKYKKFGPIEITRGCPFVCKFCQTPFIFGVKPRHRSVSAVCKYVKMMLKENKTDIRFISPNAFAYGSSDGRQINIEALENLLKSIREVIGNKGRIFFGTFPSEVRPEFVIPETVELVKRYCNNDNLVIGGQTGSERMLKFIHRGHSVEDIYKAVEITIKLGLKANVDFIFGLPGETEEDKIQTLDVIKDLTKMGARIHAHTFIPLVGTPFGSMKPGKIDEKTRREIQRLISGGKLYGEWEKQEHIAMATKRS